MINIRFITSAVSVFFFFGLAFGQPSAGSVSLANPEKAVFMPLSAVKEGMRGTARTVFRGSKPEEFNVEILGVVPGGIGPKQDLIVGRLSGGEAERTSVFAGMSGSPVYIDGKLVGAISYSFAFAKEPICGITPIEQMISIFEKKTGEASQNNEPRPISFAELAANEWKPDLGSRSLAVSNVASVLAPNSRLAAVAGQSFQPIATPLTFSGFSQAALDHFAPQLMQAGLIPVSSAGGSAAITPLKKADENTLLGGDSVSMQLTRGDYSLAAAGTVTWRNGTKIYAFGHPYLNLGTSDLPMSESHVITVIPNLNNSFKIAVPDAMVGSMTQDRATGVFGTLGKAPRMIPVRINLETSRGGRETLNYEVAIDDLLTPLLLNVTIYNAAIAQERGIGDTTVTIEGSIKIKGHEPVRIDRRFSGSTASQLASAAVAVPISVLMKSSFEGLDVTGIELNIGSTDGSKTAVLEKMSIDKAQVRPGDLVEIQAFARTNFGRVFVQRIPMRIPTDTPAGSYSITVGDGGAIQQSAANQQFVPRDLSELIRTLNDFKRTDRLYAQTFRTTTGAVVGASEMPNLPPSVLATMNNDRTAGGVKPAIQTIVSEIEVAPADFIISGQQTLSIQVIK